MPLLHVRGIWFGKEAPCGSRADFDKQLAAPVADDVAFVTAPDKTGAQIAGGVLSLNAEKLALRFDGDDRTINRDRLLGLVFAAHPKIPGIEGPYQGFLLSSGQSFTGQWVGWTRRVWRSRRRGTRA